MQKMIFYSTNIPNQGKHGETFRFVFFSFFVILRVSNCTQVLVLIVIYRPRHAEMDYLILSFYKKNFTEIVLEVH